MTKPAATVDVPSAASSLLVNGLSRRTLLCALPGVAFVGLAMMLSWGLGRKSTDLPSALIGKSVPTFDLPAIQGRKLGLSSRDLVGQVSLVNVFASWCVPCRDEHPQLLRFAATKAAPLHGINYKDAPEDASRWLNTFGDPYLRTGADLNGRVAIDWGVYGVPETFVVTADGRIAHRHIGPITEQDLDETILPLIDRLKRDAARAR